MVVISFLELLWGDWVTEAVVIAKVSCDGT